MVDSYNNQLSVVLFVIWQSIFTCAMVELIPTYMSIYNYYYPTNAEVGVNFDTLNLANIINWLDLSLLLFLIGIIGVIWSRRNFVIMLLSLELMFFAVSLNFVFIGVYSNTFSGQNYALLIVIVAAAETAIGLALLVLIHRTGKPITFNSLNNLRG